MPNPPFRFAHAFSRLQVRQERTGSEGTTAHTKMRELASRDRQLHGLIVSMQSARFSGRERLVFVGGGVKDRHRLEAIVAGVAVPEICGTAAAFLDPFGQCDRLTALRAGILLGQLLGQISESRSGHGVLPFCFDFAFLGLAVWTRLLFRRVLVGRAFISRLNV